MTNPPVRINGHLQFKNYVKGRFPIPNQKDLKDKLEFFRGDTITLEIQIFDQCEDPVDITGWDLVFTVKCEEWDAAILYQVNSTDDPKLLYASNAPQGVVSATVPPSVTEAWETGQYIFDLQLRKASIDPELEDTVKTAIRAWFIVKRDVTLPPA